MSEAKFESPLAHARLPSHKLSIELAEISDRGMIDLRGDPGDSGFRAAVKKVLGTDLPSLPRSSVVAGDISLLWLSIDQWLICCPRGQVAQLHQDLTAALVAVHALAVDVSDARAIIRLTGSYAREVLMKGVPVDLTLPDYGPGLVRRVQFAEIGALIHFPDQSPEAIDLYVFRSYADYAWNWLCETGKAAANVDLFSPNQVSPGA